MARDHSNNPNHLSGDDDHSQWVVSLAGTQPITLVSDNGTQFTSAEFVDLRQALQSDRMEMGPRHSRREDRTRYVQRVINTDRRMQFRSRQAADTVPKRSARQAGSSHRLLPLGILSGIFQVDHQARRHRHLSRAPLHRHIHKCQSPVQSLSC